MTGLIRVFNDIGSTLFRQAINLIVFCNYTCIDQNVGIKFMWTYFPTIKIHISLTMFQWRLETKLVHAYEQYRINNKGNAEYCREAFKMYLAKRRVCYCLHPESRKRVNYHLPGF